MNDYSKYTKKQLLELIKSLEKAAVHIGPPFALHYKLNDEEIEKLLKLRSICIELKYANIGFNMFNSNIEKGTLNFNIIEYSIGGSKYSNLPSQLIVTTQREEVNNIYYDFMDIYNYVDDKIMYINTRRHLCNLQMDEDLCEHFKFKSK